MQKNNNNNNNNIFFSSSITSREIHINNHNFLINKIGTYCNYSNVCSNLVGFNNTNSKASVNTKSFINLGRDDLMKSNSNKALLANIPLALDLDIQYGANSFFEGIVNFYDQVKSMSSLIYILFAVTIIGAVWMIISKYSSGYNNNDDDCCCGESCGCCEHKRPIKKSDVPLAWGLYFQDGASPSFEGIVDLHDRIMFYLVVILFGVTWVMLSIIWNFNKSHNKLVYRYLNHGTLIELIWTVGPALVLVAIAFPSFKLLYLMDEVIDPAMTVKVTGHQWYWEYEYADFLNEENEAINFDSYMKDEASLEKGELRLLEVDNPVVLPVDTHIRFIITGADVLHSWAVPSLGIKVDACPGRLNQASVIIERTGHFYGQCSEICGVLHSSMPIKIEAVEVEKFFSWLLEQ